MGKFGAFLADIAKETVIQRDNEFYNQGRQDQADIDIQIFVAALQDIKVTKERIMDVLYEYFGISDRGIANQVIEDSQQWRKKKIQVKQIKQNNN